MTNRIIWLIFFLIPLHSLAEVDDNYTYLRNKMVDEQILLRGITDTKILNAFEKVQRHLFVKPELRKNAYEDISLDIGEGETITEPYIVAIMTYAVAPEFNKKVLEIGTGCGYQTAVLSEITKSVFSIERIPTLLEKANNILFELGYRTVKIKLGDGTKGWQEEAPFDGIIVTAAASCIPDELIEQLGYDGRLIIPVVESPVTQTLMKIIKTTQGITIEKLYEVRFVPLIED